MKHWTIAFLLLGLCWTLSVGAEEAAPKERAISSLEIKGNRLTFYGFLRFDTIYSDSRLNHNQYSMWVNSEAPTVGRENDDFIDMYPRLTRFGLNVERDSIPAWNGAKLSGKLEIDFQNRATSETEGKESESREIPRLRHGYLEATSGGFSILAGQTWDLISPLWPSVNADAMMWNAGNLGDRRPQLRLGYRRELSEESSYSIALAAARTGAVDRKDLDSDNRRDGDESGLPMLQGRVGVSLAKRLDAGFWGHYGWEELSGSVAGKSDFNTSGLGVDLAYKMTDQITLMGEAWQGKNLSDVRGGIGQGVNTTTGEEIEAVGGWIELNYKPTKRYTIAVGYTVDDPKNEDLSTSTSRSKNLAAYISQYYDLGGGFVVGAEYINWDTNYLGVGDGTANRLDLVAMYKF